MVGTMIASEGPVVTWAQVNEALGYGLMLVVAGSAEGVEVRGKRGLLLIRLRVWQRNVEAVVAGGSPAFVMARAPEGAEDVLARQGWMAPTTELRSWRRCWDRNVPLGAIAQEILLAAREAFDTDATSVSVDAVVPVQ